MALPARTGFKEVVDVGTSVTYPITAPTNPLRCSEVSITPRQAVELPDLIQGGVDRTAYQIGERVVEGTLSFPLVAEVGAASTVGTPPGSTSDFVTVDDGVDTIFSNAINNANSPSTLYDTFEVGTTYHGIFKNCMVNELTIDGREGGPVEVSAAIWPTHIQGDLVSETDTEGGAPSAFFDLEEVEVIMFYNVRINGGNDIEIGSWSLDPDLIRSFSLRVANNLVRNFTYNQSESAHDVTFGLRRVEGNFTFQLNYNTTNNPASGRFPRFADIMSKAAGTPELTFECGGGVTPGFTYTFTVRNPIFEASNQPISVGVLTQTVNFYAVADGSDYAILYTPYTAP